MEFYFYPADENKFKQEAVGNFVKTLVYDSTQDKVVLSFTRKVNKLWEQTCKNNIETDHRIKDLSNDGLQVFSWITPSKEDFKLPGFSTK